jgi:hypothetical protein
MIKARPFWQWVKLNVEALFNRSHYVRRTYHIYRTIIHTDKEPIKDIKPPYAVLKER